MGSLVENLEKEILSREAELVYMRQELSDTRGIVSSLTKEREKLREELDVVVRAIRIILSSGVEK